MCPASPGGDAPPIFFVCDKENGPRPVQKKNAWAQSRRRRRLFCLHTGVERDGASVMGQSPAGCAQACRNRESASPHLGARSGFRVRSPRQLRVGNPKGRGRSPAPLSRFKGVRGEIEIPPGFSLGGVGGHFSFQKRNVPPSLVSPEGERNLTSPQTQTRTPCPRPQSPAWP